MRFFSSRSAAELQSAGASVRRRDGRRYECHLEAKLRGRGGRFRVLAVNASRSGVLLEVQDGSFRSSGRGWDALGRQCFRTGADIEFVEADLRLRADYARVVAAGPGQNPRIAFRFRKKLTLDECRALHIGADDDGTEPGF